MTSRGQRRAWAVTRVLKHELTMTDATDLVGLWERQVWRLWVAFERDGPAGAAPRQPRSTIGTAA